jgi:Holliday junction resolvase
LAAGVRCHRGVLGGVCLRRAAKVDSTQAAIVKALRGYGCSVTSLAPVGNGCPDLLVGIHKRTGLIECKTDEASRTKTQGLRDKQIKWWQEWKGGPVAIVTDVDGALRFARMLAFEL